LHSPDVAALRTRPIATFRCNVAAGVADNVAASRVNPPPVFIMNCCGLRLTAALMAILDRLRSGGTSADTCTSASLGFGVGFAARATAVLAVVTGRIFRSSRRGWRLSQHCDPVARRQGFAG